MELLLRVNGIQPAFGIELGFDSPRTAEVRSADPYRQANVSYSGYEDRNHPEQRVNGSLTLDRLRQELLAAATGLDVQPARHGMILGPS
jgi:hypothetical protein